MSNTTIPSYLSAEAEIKESDQPAKYKSLDNNSKAIVFIMLSYKSIAKLSKDLPHESIISIVSNSIVETGWGRSWKGWNFGGWKINKGDADAYKARTGKPAPWWQAAGHVNSGDSEICYYRGFPGPLSFYKEWLERFVPKNASTSHRYYKTGQAFWNDQPWFPELIQAGYKGAVTKANPQPSIDAHEQIIRSVKIRMAQQLLGLTPDSAWGAKSTKACTDYQKANGLNVTGSLNEETLYSLLNKWEKNGMPLPASILDESLIPELSLK